MVYFNDVAINMSNLKIMTSLFELILCILSNDFDKAFSKQCQHVFMVLHLYNAIQTEVIFSEII